MNCVGIIPARYQSSRFEGKPLADIHGRPMIWWVYNQAIKAQGLSAVYVATDDARIEAVCKQYTIPCIMTRNDHYQVTSRLYEVATKIQADYYICINGDEPLIDHKLIEKIIPQQAATASHAYTANLMTKMSDPVEVIDTSNIKIVLDGKGDALYMSRMAIPYPKSSMKYSYYKHVGLLAYSFKALEFFATSPAGRNELIEDIDMLRFIENGIKMKMIEVEAHTLSVDTPKDLVYVREVMQVMIDKGQLEKPLN